MGNPAVSQETAFETHLGHIFVVTPVEAPGDPHSFSNRFFQLALSEQVFFWFFARAGFFLGRGVATIGTYRSKNLHSNFYIRSHGSHFFWHCRLRRTNDRLWFYVMVVLLTSK